MWHARYTSKTFRGECQNSDWFNPGFELFPMR